MEPGELTQYNDQPITRMALIWFPTQTNFSSPLSPYQLWVPQSHLCNCTRCYPWRSRRQQTTCHYLVVSLKLHFAIPPLQGMLLD